MLKTPFGMIRIIKDDKEISYHAREYKYPKPPVTNDPIEGCFRIFVPAQDAHMIQCELVSEESASLDSGERYLCVTFCKNENQLAIGAIDESADFFTDTSANGVQYQLKNPVKSVVFGIAWTTNYQGTDDCRVWYAADPTMN